MCLFFFSSRRRHTRCSRDWSSDVCSSDLAEASMYLRFTLGTMGVSDGSDITITGIKTEDEVLVCYATDETSAEGLDEVAAEVEITDDDTIQIDQVSPTVTGGAKLWVFW